MWCDTLERDGYAVVEAHHPDKARQLRVLIAAKQALRPRSRRRFGSMWPGTVASAEIHPAGNPLEVHAVHVPNGGSRQHHSSALAFVAIDGPAW